MRSSVPGNLPAAGAAPRLCPHGKQEEDGKGGRRREKERGEWGGGREESRDEWGCGSGVFINNKPGVKKIAAHLKNGFSFFNSKLSECFYVLVHACWFTCFFIYYFKL